MEENRREMYDSYHIKVINYIIQLANYQTSNYQTSNLLIFHTHSSTVLFKNSHILILHGLVRGVLLQLVQEMGFSERRSWNGKNEGGKNERS